MKKKGFKTSLAEHHAKSMLARLFDQRFHEYVEYLFVLGETNVQQHQPIPGVQFSPDLTIRDKNGNIAAVVEIKSGKTAHSVRIGLSQLINVAQKIHPPKVILVTAAEKDIFDAKMLARVESIAGHLRQFNTSLEIWTKSEILKYSKNKAGLKVESLDFNALRNALVHYRAPEKAEKVYSKLFGDKVENSATWVSFLGSHINLRDAHEETLRNTLPETIFDVEHRNVLVLMTDIVSFTAFVSHTKSQDLLSRIMLRFYAEAKRIIHAHGGWVDKFLGDAVIAYWGVANQNSAALDKVIDCAIELNKLAQTISREWQEKIDEAVYPTGGHTGITLGSISLLRTDSIAYDYTAIGDVINLASRLQSDAKANEILVSNLVKQMADKQKLGRTFTPVKSRKKAGVLFVKNHAPIMAWKLVS